MRLPKSKRAPTCHYYSPTYIDGRWAGECTAPREYPTRDTYRCNHFLNGVSTCPSFWDTTESDDIRKLCPPGPFGKKPMSNYTGNDFVAEDGTVYVAEESSFCDGCAFDKTRHLCMLVGCSPIARPDNRYVRWIKRAKAESEPNPL